MLFGTNHRRAGGDIQRLARILNRHPEAREATGHMGRRPVDIHVEHRPDAAFVCPVCSQQRPLYDHADARVWRHLDSCQLKTFLHARVPRTCCPEHGIHKVKLPWAQTRSRFTLLMERMIIDVILQCSTIEGACNIMRVSWDEAFGVMQRSFQRGQVRKQASVVRHLGVDEKAFRKGHSYMTVVCDLERATVEYVGDDRQTESLAGYYASLTPTQLQGIKAVAMDMWEPISVPPSLNRVDGLAGIGLGLLCLFSAGWNICQQSFTVWREREAFNATFVLQNLQFLPSFNIPKSCGIVPCPGRQLLAIRAEDHANN
jgi:hypothetical protein